MKKIFKAVIWLHFLRLFRYKWSLINQALGTFLWIIIYIIGTSLFMIKEEEKILIQLFWIITAWQYIRISARLIGNWIDFFTAIGMIEEHLLRNISPFTILSGRVITSTSVTVITTALTGLIIKTVFDVNILNIYNPFLLILGFFTLIIQCIYYGKILSILSLGTSISYSFWGYLNFSSLALFVIPPEKLMFPLNILIVSLPFTSSVYLLKNGINGINSFTLLTMSLLFSFINGILLKIIENILAKKVLKNILKNGYRGIGYM
ncbi:MAG: hypothetical protein J7K23_06325 [Thermoproteales archaeon]|nr:hypothetical protein [Thermoproteales archaeon]